MLYQWRVTLHYARAVVGCFRLSEEIESHRDTWRDRTIGLTSLSHVSMNDEELPRIRLLCNFLKGRVANYSSNAIFRGGHHLLMLTQLELESL